MLPDNLPDVEHYASLLKHQPVWHEDPLRRIGPVAERLRELVNLWRELEPLPADVEARKELVDQRLERCVHNSGNNILD